MSGEKVLLWLAGLGLLLPMVICLVVATGAQASAPRTLVAANNAARVEMGRKPLKVSPALMRLADKRAHRLARIGHLTHSGFADAVHRAGYENAGENIAFYAPTPVSSQTFVKMWKESPPHAHNLYDTRWTKIGTGVARINSREYAVVIFAQ